MGKGGTRTRLLAIQPSLSLTTEFVTYNRDQHISTLQLSCQRAERAARAVAAEAAAAERAAEVEAAERAAEAEAAERAAEEENSADPMMEED